MSALVAAGCDPGPAPGDGGTADAPGADAPADAGDPCSADADCDDGLFCTGEEICEAGRCVAGTRACDDGVACTIDRCSEERLRCENVAPDADADGYGDASCVDGAGAPIGNDCDDTDDTRFPGNAEVCDDVGHDEDCDPATRGGLDADGDGFESARCCNPVPGGGRSCGEDCDDARRQVNPTGTEVCDGLDDDCDGTIDDGVQVTVYVDADRDGRGDPATSRMACPGIGGLVSIGDDCDDTRADRHPAQLEFCDGIDNDCDGLVDDAAGPVRWYTDSDGDGFGSAASGSVESCTPIAGASLLGTDCDDGRASVSPAAAELCDGIDNDCSGTPDFVIAPGDLEDDDADGYVDIACGPPFGEDCDDRNAVAGPGEPESCDGRDNDCDTSIDEDVTTYAWFRDADGDGYGSNVTELVVSCMTVGGHVRRGGDCDDASPGRNPGAIEVCNGRDEDCDVSVDEAPASDACVDALGADMACVAGSCRPVACNTGLGDCDGSDTNGCEVTFASDAQNCGACGRSCPTAPSASSSCSAGSCGALACVPGRVDCNGDLAAPGGDGCETAGSCPVCVSDAGCDDGALCNGRETCDLGTGACVPGGGPPDADGDGQTPSACGGTDCDDARADVRPGAPETCDGVDQDCDGLIDDAPVVGTTYYRDADRDGRGDASSPLVACAVAPAGYVLTSDDCDDTRSDVRPGAPETCDGVDQDCDAIVDDGALGAASWYRDADGDGRGDASMPTTACVMPAGHVASSDDCDDTRASVRPGAPETCDGIDEDCDGIVDDDPPSGATFFRDADGDGYGDAFDSVRACVRPSGFSANGDDCSDVRPDIHRGAPEICDGIDQDCDGRIDDDPAVPGVEAYLDRDGDGWGDGASPATVCALGPGLASTGGDCNDGRMDVRPGAPEICDGIDQDCDGLVDDACTPVCTAPLVPCASACVDTRNDPANCGTCGLGCPSGPNATPICVMSSCATFCAPGFGDCDAMPATGCEANFATSALHCGRCGNACLGEPHASRPCNAGTCGALVCDAGFVDCDGSLGTGGNGCETPGASCPRVLWGYTWGDANDDWNTGSGRDFEITTDGAGNVYAVGTYGSDVTVAGVPYTAARFAGVVVSVSPTGTFRWATNVRATGSGDLLPTRIFFDPATNAVYVGGTGWGGAAMVGSTNIGTQNGNCDAFLARLSPADGSVAWGRTYPNASCSSLRGLARAASGDLVAAGYFQGTHVMDGFMVTNTGGSNSDGFVATVNPASGSTTGLFRFGAPAADEQLQGVAVLPGGDIVVIGNYAYAAADIGGIGLPWAGTTWDVFHARFTPAGAVVRAAAISTANLEHATDIAVGPSGDYYLAGYYDGSTNVGGTALSGASYGAFLARVSAATGAYVWASGTQGSSNAFWGIRRILVDGTETLRFAVLMSSNVGTTFAGMPLPTAANLRVMRVSGATGLATRIETLTPAGLMSANAIGILPDGRAVIGGDFNASTSIDGVPFNNAGAGYDHYVMLLGPGI